MRNIVVGLSIWMCLVSVVVGADAPPASQPAAAGGAYGSAVGRARFLPEGYKAPTQRLQFVVFGDRNGGEQPGFMEQGIDLVNLLRPEFIVSIGDQIAGYVAAGKGITPEQAMRKIRDQWVEQDALVARFDVPYFWAVGNHDIWDKPSSKYYTDRHGPRYYSFDARNVHVIVLDSEEYQAVGGKGMLGDAQITWLNADLDRSKDAALTVIALHHPVWANKERGDWSAVESMLAGRNAIVFAGHYHEYTCEMRGGIPYVIVGPVAGEQSDRNDALGRFRHVTLVTVEDGKPYVAVVKLGAALPMDAVPWKTQEYLDTVCSASRLDHLPPEPSVDQPVTVTWYLTNPLDVATKVEAAWLKDSAWQIEPAPTSVVLQPKETRRVEFQGRLRLKGADQPPTLQAKFSWPGTDVRATQMDWQALPLRRMQVAALKGIQIDGQVDAAWQAVPPTALDSLQQFSNGLKGWHGPKDLSVRMRAGLEETKLYLLLEVTDDDIQPGKDSVMLELAAVPLEKVVNRSYAGMYRFTIRAPKDDGQQEICWESKGHLEGEAAARRVDGGWTAEVALDISPVLKTAGVERAVPFDLMVTDSDADQAEPTYVLWSGTRETHDRTAVWGVLEMPAGVVEAAR